jgi:hypothetical protein
MAVSSLSTVHEMGPNPSSKCTSGLIPRRAVETLYTTVLTIKYWNNLRTQQSIFSSRFYCALLALHVSAPFGGHRQVVRKHKKYLR